MWSYVVQNGACRRLRAHDNVCIGAVWHPHEPSQVVTCSWDGTVKIWD